jgi:hypothetical protein
MSALLWGAWGSEWALYSKVTFDGVEKTIHINPGELIINVKDDIYSAWKRWVRLYDYAKFLPALRTIGGDPVGGGQFAGDMYFLINGWRIVIHENIKMNGIIYSDDYPSPFIITAGGGVTNKVSNMAYAYNTAGVVVPTVQEIRNEMDVNSTKLTAINTKVQTLTNAPSAATVAAQVRTELTTELAHLMALQNNTGLTPTQATMLLEMFDLLGLDPAKPLVVTDTSRTAGAITQTIASNSTSTTVHRV